MQGRKSQAPVTPFSKFARLAIAGICCVYSCTQHEEPPEFEISPEPITSHEIAEPGARNLLKTLENITGTSGKLYDAVADVRTMLEAEELERAGRYQDAANKWFAALSVAEDRFGKAALDGWIKAYTKALAKQTDRQVLAKLLLAEARNGQYSPYMAARGLFNDAALIPILEALVPEWLLPLADTTSPEVTPKGPKTPKTQIPSDDPLLTKTAANYCQAKGSRIPDWELWQAALPTAAKPYWSALILQCQRQDIEALKAFKELYPTLIGSQATATTRAWGLESLTRAVTLERAIGTRSVAADLYIELMALWQHPELTAQALGMTPIDLALKRINDTLWAGRYRALIADYEQAKILAQTALELVTNAHGVQPQLTSKDKQALASYKAEAYHDLAFRIALENKEFESALSLTVIALDVPNLTGEWRDRLQWFAGLYDYLAGHFDGAKRRWETMLATTKDDSQRAMLFFWLAKVHDQLNQKAESLFYISALVDEYPLNYYAVVAAPTSGLSGGQSGLPERTSEKKWNDLFNNYPDLVERLVDRKDYQLQALRQDAALEPLLLRAEIMVAAELGDWAKLSVAALDTKMQSMLASQNQIPAFVYLSRLHYNAGNYAATIAITTKLAQTTSNFWKDWPEQLLVYFPRPYDDIYRRMATTLNLDKELLLGISRQESAFAPDIRSSANAAGVMQLIRPTALRFAVEANIPAKDVDRLLINPEVNINLGSRYLKFLDLEYRGYQPAVLGAYNAGEAAVDIWLKRRAHSDPISFVELIPFGETKSYIRNVWRNILVYRFLNTGRSLADVAKIKIDVTHQNKRIIEVSAGDAGRRPDLVHAPR